MPNQFIPTRIKASNEDSSAERYGHMSPNHENCPHNEISGLSVSARDASCSEASRQGGLAHGGGSSDVVIDGASYLPSRHTVPIVSVDMLDEGVVQLVIRDRYIAEHAQPAQFANLYTHDGLRLMPRPFGICEIHGDEVSFVFAIVGAGTAQFSRLKAGDRIDVLGPLGTSFDLDASARYLLVGGGLGVPPLIQAAQELHREGRTEQVTAIFGYRRNHFADAIVGRYTEDVRSIDETEGNVITVLDRMEDELAQGSDRIVILSCGPTPMMKAIAGWASRRSIPTQFNLEERMGCGYGTCVVCVVDTIHGRKKVCLDGPVFTAQELGWEDEK
ncbi:MAG: dihydroorotate dehydrogenase electron transfer subunit [Bifidobacterium sp.]|uniref:Dihydroorotate dehydrogenase electron transfer subunit n=2 Tax=Bifidobacterium TaxID=1678 RepID=A0AB39UPA1_9BIFI